MDFSYIEATQTSELTEPEDKSFVNEFIDAKGKIWERNNFLDTYDVNNSGRTNTASKFDLSKFESGPTEECLSVKSEIDSKQFIDKEIKISDEEVFIKYEHYVDVKTDNDGNRAIISEIEVDLFEEDNKTMVHKLIDRESWHEEPTLENSVKLEEVNKETSEVELNSSEVTVKRCKSKFCGNTSLRNHKCCHCDYKAIRKSQLEDHINSVHLGIKKHKCSQCGYQTTQKHTLTAHVNSVHLEMKNYGCSQCEFRTSLKIRLQRHINSVHLGIKNYNCDECGYQASQKHHLIAHINTVHLGLKNYSCNQCDYKASQKRYITYHINSNHLGIKNRKCSQCDYSTALKIHLQRHIDSVHLGIKNYKCHACDYEASQKHHLRAHVNSVHLALKNYSCTQCDYKASQKRYITYHVNSVHLGIKKQKSSKNSI